TEDRRKKQRPQAKSPERSKISKREGSKRRLRSIGSENVLPVTDAVCSTCFSRSGSRSIRAAKTLCTLARTPRPSRGFSSRYAPPGAHEGSRFLQPLDAAASSHLSPAESVNRHRLGEPLERHPRFLGDATILADQLTRALVHEDLPGAGDLTEPRGEVDRR